MKLAVATAAAAVLASFPAAAQVANMQCAERDNLVADLQAQFEERQKAIGLTAEGRLIEVFAAEDGTWTMLLTTADSVSCIVSHGVNWFGTADRNQAELPSSGSASGLEAEPWRDAGLRQ